jgi:hypothetical protein
MAMDHGPFDHKVVDKKWIAASLAGESGAVPMLFEKRDGQIVAFARCKGKIATWRFQVF